MHGEHLDFLGRIVEAQEESEEDDEIIFTLFVDGEIVYLGQDFAQQPFRRNPHHLLQGKT